MVPLLLDLGTGELVIILVIALLLFGGSRLAGLGKSAGRAIKEFKEETGSITAEPQDAVPDSAETTTSGGSAD